MNVVVLRGAQRLIGALATVLAGLALAPALLLLAWSEDRAMRRGHEPQTGVGESL